jgi:DNA polymerase-3 subunit delta'
VGGFVTKGQPAAVGQIQAMLAAGLPHGLLLTGPRAVGKTTLALDIAAALLCLEPDVAARPCRACRGCRLVEDGNHPDLHRLAPDGPGGLIGIDAVRGLISELALLPVEGGARLAIIESAHRLTEDAQNALLKTLEEPPAGVTLVLCAEDEDRLLPTIHSRVARVRLGTVGVREIEALLEERGEADAPSASRYARLADGRPGLAIAYARSPEAATIRGEIARTLLDLLDAPRAQRLIRVRDLLARAADLGTALAPAAASADIAGRAAGGKRRGRGAPAAPAAVASDRAESPLPATADGGTTDEPDAAAPASGITRAAPAERRRAAAMLLEVWRDTARDLALVELGDVARLHDPDLLEELRAAAARVPAASVGDFLRRMDRAGQLLDVNANPELLADVLALAWPTPRPRRAA